MALMLLFAVRMINDLLTMTNSNCLSSQKYKTRTVVELVQQFYHATEIGIVANTVSTCTL